MNPKLFLCLALVLSSYCRAAIVFPAAPEKGRQIAYEKVSRVIQAFPQMFKGLATNELTITNAQRMYAVSPQEVVSNNLLSAAKLYAWLYPFVHETNAVLSAPVFINPKDGKLSKRGGVMDGKLVKDMLVALQKADELPQVKKQDYECRYLVMPPSFVAAWLHGKSDDIIIPLPPTYYGKKAYQPYTEKAIIKLLKPEAENILYMAKKYPHLPG
ncbi:MAG TPA: hypothetical protein VKQ08_05360 [Cyclobacteriaceae bacterium]|nr:hypothetical protein [Cyclobacteriaceae bacterium]